MTILQKVFMLRTPDGIVEKVGIKEDTLDCASYLSRSGLTFNGCFKAKRGELMVSKGLYQLYNGPLFDFTARGKIIVIHQSVINIKFPHKSHYQILHPVNIPSNLAPSRKIEKRTII